MPPHVCVCMLVCLCACTLVCACVQGLCVNELRRMCVCVCLQVYAYVLCICIHVYECLAGVCFCIFECVCLHCVGECHPHPRDSLGPKAPLEITAICIEAKGALRGISTPCGQPSQQSPKPLLRNQLVTSKKREPAQKAPLAPQGMCGPVMSQARPHGAMCMGLRHKDERDPALEAEQAGGQCRASHPWGQDGGHTSLHMGGAWSRGPCPVHAHCRQRAGDASLQRDLWLLCTTTEMASARQGLPGALQAWI